MYGLLKRKNEGLRSDLIRFAQELIRTPSPSLHEERVADVVQHEMEKLGYDEVFRDQFGNVVGLLRGRKASPNVVLNSHMDTVVPLPGADWQRSPYSGEIENGWIHGLGASDCKGGLAAQIYAGALLQRSMLPLQGNVIVAATVAEENGLSIGMRSLIEKTLPSYELRPDYAVLGEPTGLKLYHGHEGWTEFEIRVKGENDFIVHDAVEALSHNLARHFAGSHEPDSEGIKLQHPSFNHEHGLNSGTFKVTRRLRDNESITDLLGRIKHEADLTCPSAGAVSFDVEVCSEDQQLYNGHRTCVRSVVGSWSTDPFHPLVDRARQLLDAAGCKARAGKWQLKRLGMGTAGSVLAGEHAIPTVGYGPGDEEQAHQTNERIEIEKLQTAVYGTAAIVHGLAGIPVFGWTSDDI